MGEQRKYATLFAATLLCARKLIESIESEKPNLAKQHFVDRAIQEVEFILEHIEKKWPVKGVSRLRECGYFFANSCSRHR